MNAKLRTLLSITAALILTAGLVFAAGGYSVPNYREPGGARWVVGGSLDVISGGEIDVEAGAVLKIAGQAVTLPTSAGAVLQTTLTTNQVDIANSIWGTSNNFCYEGSSADDYETCITPTNPTADRTITLPNASGTVVISTLATNAPDAANAVTMASNGLVFEGATADDFETTLTPVDPTLDVSLTLPAWSGGVTTIISESAVATAAVNETISAFTLAVPANVLQAGTQIRFTCAGTKAGANAAANVKIYVDNLAIVTTTIQAAGTGDWVFNGMVVEHTNLANQKVFGTLLLAGNGQTVTADYGTDTTDFSTAKNIIIQLVSGHASDTMTMEYCMAEFLP